mmetsp:Transcript_25896/g.42779  ORF Transcript_25896/g.42779 Transcript_25896/m.42779 type:complete len:216 (+) Transcript_25896:150-797(+)
MSKCLKCCAKRCNSSLMYLGGSVFTRRLQHPIHEIHQLHSLRSKDGTHQRGLHYINLFVWSPLMARSCRRICTLSTRRQLLPQLTVGSTYSCIRRGSCPCTVAQGASGSAPSRTPRADTYADAAGGMAAGSCHWSRSSAARSHPLIQLAPVGCRPTTANQLRQITFGFASFCNACSRRCRCRRWLSRSRAAHMSFFGAKFLFKQCLSGWNGRGRT